MLCAATLGLSACNGSSSSDKPSPSASVSTSATPATSASATPTVKPSTIANLDAIKVSGADGKQPTINATWPITIAKTQSKVLKKGSGETVSASSWVRINYVGVNGRTGKVFDSSFTRGAPATFNLKQVVPGFGKGLTGKHVGDRVLIMMPGSDGYDSQGGSAQAGILKGDSLVFVVDIVGSSIDTPSGTTVTPAANLPTVKMAQGVPNVVIGKATKPNKLVVQPLIKGKGAKVTDKDVIVAKYRTYSWSDGKLREDSYNGEGVTGSVSSLLPGWRKGLVGQTVGSRVMLIVPPADAYPEGNSSIGVKKGETLVYVIDIVYAEASS